MIPKFQFAD